MQNNPFYVHPGNDFGAQLTGLGQTIGEYGKVKRQRDELAKKEARFLEVKQAMTEALASNDPTKIAQVSIDYPEAQQTMLAAWKTKNEGTKQNLKDSTMRILSGESPERVLNERIAMVEAAGGDATQSRQELEVYRSDPAGYQQKVLNGAAWMYPEEVLARQKALRGGVDESPTQFGAQVTFKDAEGNLFLGTQKRNPNTGAVESALSPVGGGPEKPVGQVQMVGTYGLTASEAVGQKGAEAGASATGKLSAELALKPQVEAAVAKAKSIATAKGEKFTEVEQMNAAFPSLVGTVDSLREVADVATYTMGGRAFDAVVKEIGFGSTKGGDARVKFVSIVNNQVLPLLKSTFGAAFTEREGETLKATMGDPNATPAQKMLQLDAFIQQKARNIQSGQRELHVEVTPIEVLLNPAPEGVSEEDIKFTMESHGLSRKEVIEKLKGAK